MLEPTAFPSEDAAVPCIVAIDPGRDKCGIAVMARDGTLRHRKVVPTAVLREEIGKIFQNYPVQRIVLGNGTTSDRRRQELEAAGWPVDVVDERGTTVAARRRYFQEHPPRGLSRLIPPSFRTPPVPYDDYVAVLLAEHYWHQRETASPKE